MCIYIKKLVGRKMGMKLLCPCTQVSDVSENDTTMVAHERNCIEWRTMANWAENQSLRVICLKEMSYF